MQVTVPTLFEGRDFLNVTAACGFEERMVLRFMDCYKQTWQTNEVPEEHEGLKSMTLRHLKGDLQLLHKMGVWTTVHVDILREFLIAQKMETPDFFLVVTRDEDRFCPLVLSDRTIDFEHPAENFKPRGKVIVWNLSSRLALTTPKNVS